jgi:amino acid transporter
VSEAICFNWLLALSGLSSLFTWASICYAHIRFRHAWKLQGHTLEELPFCASGGVIGSWLGFTMNILALSATLYSALFPIGGTLGTDDGGKPDAEIFFLYYLAVPTVVVFFIGYIIYDFRQHGFAGMLPVDLRTVDLDTGRKNFPSLELLRLVAFFYFFYFFYFFVGINL